MKIKVNANKPKFTPIEVNVTFTIENAKELAEFNRINSLLDEGENIYLTDDEGNGVSYSCIDTLIEKIADSVR